MTKWPNFIIVGAAKSGTTSLYYYLRDHPEVFFSSPKEPSYFSKDFLNYPFSDEDKRSRFFMDYLVTDEQSYLNLFRHAGDAKAVGEATPNYLFYKDCAKTIKAKIPHAKIIISLRNPVDRAFSLYMMNVRDLDETEDFDNALKLEEMRIQKNYHYAWFYKKSGLYYDQVKAFKDLFGENVKIILFEDFMNDLQGTMKDICKFLNIDQGFYTNYSFAKFNVSGRPRIRSINYLLRQKNVLRSVVRRILPYHFRHKATFHILKWNSKKESMPPMVRLDLVKYFQEDIEKLSHLIDRDLSPWLM